MPDPRRARRIAVAAAVALALIVSALVPAAGALEVSSAAIKVVGSSEYPDNVESYAGQTSSFTGPLNGQGISIAVLDTGVDNRHPVFGAAYLAGAQVQRPCQDEDCITDQDLEGNCFDPDDTNGHGTHVASIALGRGGDGAPRGIASGARLVDVKIADDVTGMSLNAIADAIDWVIRFNKGETACNNSHPVRVISISFASTQPHTSKDRDDAMKAVKRAHDNGILVVAAAGNCGPGNGDVNDGLSCPTSKGENSITSPGAAPEALTVGAVADMNSTRRAQDPVAPYSSRGPNPGSSGDVHWRKPDVVAPGTHIEAACKAPATSTEPQRGQGMGCNMTGTSMATPHVSGLAAILFQAGNQEGSYSPDTVKELITSTAEDWSPKGPGDDGWDRHTGYGYVDGYAAVVEAMNSPPRSEFGYRSPSSPPIVGEEITFDASLTVDPDDDPIDRYVWDFGDGSPVLEAEGEQPAVHHTYNETGTYEVSLTAVDGHGTEDPTPYTKEITVDPPPPPDPGEAPRANLTFHPEEPKATEPVVLDASKSQDPDDDSIVRYDWFIDQAGRKDGEPEKQTTAPRLNWTFEREGTYDIRVRVLDERGLQDTETRTVVVAPPPPGPPVVNITNPKEGDVVDPGRMLSAWTLDSGDADRYVVYLDSVQKETVASNRIVLNVSEGNHTLRVVGQGPAGEHQDWVNFTAAEDEPLEQTSESATEPRASDGSSDDPAPSLEEAQEAGTVAPVDNGTDEQKDAPLAPLLTVLAALVAVLHRRRR